jgi:hypothetical protein
MAVVIAPVEKSNQKGTKELIKWVLALFFSKL